MTTPNHQSDFWLSLNDLLEAQESRLLTWGVGDGSLSRAEILGLLDTRSLEGLSPEEALSRLEELHLVLRADPDGTLYRTRSAEIVRLLSKLTQWFPPGERRSVGRVTIGKRSFVSSADAESWPAAAPLVAGFRYLARPRQRPIRDLPAQSVIAALEPKFRDNEKVASAIHGILGTRELSGFQARATREVLAGGGRPHDSGTVITAGTGSGKTLGFYLPAIVSMLTQPNRGSGPTVIAVYPRQELLRDQLMTAYRELDAVKDRARDAIGRPLRLGVLFGDVPSRASDVVREGDGAFYTWGRSNELEGRICPIIRCPICDASQARQRNPGDLVWLEEDRKSNRMRLQCSRHDCGVSIDDDQFVFLRNELQRTVPDVLFITMEMLSRDLQNQYRRHVLGLESAPKFVLLDEIHTYTSISGAQNALALRRWRSRCRGTSCVHFVGLSATLEAPEAFFADLTGVSTDRIAHVTPVASESESVGREYHLVLRGDPLSAKALLATTIQALMLLGRAPCVPPNDDTWQSKIFGSKVFAFTDRIDTFRRLRDDLHDADSAKRLALLRGPAEPKYRDPRRDWRRRLAGQRWTLCEKLGHDLGSPLDIGEVSAARKRYRSSNQVVIATSALEVGFDDPDVSVVLQHKAPRDWASYLQRIGRAARSIEMRPWAITVLSDYGRDRQAYLNYHEFFSPELRRRYLPITNTYVLKMQASLALLDLIVEVAPASRATLDQVLRSAALRESGWTEKAGVYLETLDRLLESPEALGRSIGRAIGLGPSSPELRDVLWRTPRSIMLEFAPALRRILKGGAHLDEKTRRPLSSYIPANLFSSLELPEITFSLPGGHKSETLSVRQAVAEFAPGNVNRRFSRQENESHWIEPGPWDAEEAFVTAELPAEQFVRAGEKHVLTIDDLDGSGSRDLVLIRPHRLELKKTPERQVAPSSKGLFLWETRVEPSAEVPRKAIPVSLPLSDVVREIEFDMHAYGQHILLTRYARSAVASLRMRTGSVKDKTVVTRFVGGTDGREPRAIGFQLETDGACLHVEIPDSLRSLWINPEIPDTRARRVEYFRSRVQAELSPKDRAGDLRISQFTTDRLLDIFLAALVSLVVRKESTVESEIEELKNDRAFFVSSMKFAIDSLLARDPSEDTTSTNDVEEELTILCEESRIVHDILLRHAEVLHESFDSGKWVADYVRWVEERAIRALGITFLETAQILDPEIDDITVSIDVDITPVDKSTDRRSVWVLENEPGGTGTVDKIRTAYSKSPMQFHAVWAARVHPDMDEMVDHDLASVVMATKTDDRVREAFGAYREATGVSALESCVKDLKKQMQSLGVHPSRQLIAALTLRVLKEGSDASSDDLLNLLLLTRDEADARLGFEAPGPAIAYLASKRESVREAVSRFAPLESVDPDGPELYQALHGWLWSRGREQALRHHSFFNAYDTGGSADVTALRCPSRDDAVVSLEDKDWFDQVVASLETGPRVWLQANGGRPGQLADAVRCLVTRTVPWDLVSLHLEVHGVRMTQGYWQACVQLPEYIG